MFGNLPILSELDTADIYEHQIKKVTTWKKDYMLILDKWFEKNRGNHIKCFFISKKNINFILLIKKIMEGKIPTAEELAYKVFFNRITARNPNEELELREMYAKIHSKPIPSKNYGWKNGRVTEPNDTVKAMIEFARLHVKAALEAASKSACTKIEECYTDNLGNESGELYDKIAVIDKNSILNAYPLDSIKK